MDILVCDWEKATFNEQIDPNILPVPFPSNFTDEETGCPLANDDYPTEERTPTGSSGSSSSDEPLIVPIKNKNKKREEAPIHDDLMSDDVIYESVKQEDKPYVPTHELQELIKTMDIINSPSKRKAVPKINTSFQQEKAQGGSTTRVADSPRKNYNAQKEEAKPKTEIGDDSTVKQKRLKEIEKALLQLKTKDSSGSMAPKPVTSTKVVEPRWALDYHRFLQSTHKEEDSRRYVRNNQDNHEVHRGLIINETL